MSISSYTYVMNLNHKNISNKQFEGFPVVLFRIQGHDIGTHS